MLKNIDLAKEKSKEFKNYKMRKKKVNVWMVLQDVNKKQVFRKDFQGK